MKRKLIATAMLTIAIVASLNLSAFATEITLGESQSSESKIEVSQLKENPNTDPAGDEEEPSEFLEDINAFVKASRSESESNNTRSTANLMNIGDTMNGVINTSSDVDCFRFYPTQSQTVTIQLSGPSSSNYDYDLWLQDSSGNALASSTISGSSGTIKYDVSSGKNYYIVVNSAKGYGQSYTVNLKGTASVNTNSLSVTRFAQQNTNWCWAASVEMIGYFQTKVDKKQPDIVKYIKGSVVNQTASASDQVKALQWYNQNAFASADYWSADTVSSFDKYVKGNFSKGHATSLSCVRSSGSGGHSFVVYNVNGDNIDLIDPWASTTKPTMRVSKNALINGNVYSIALSSNVGSSACIVY